MINIQQIFKALPHRYPFLLVDRVVDFTAHQHIQALKNVTINEAYFLGHFPNRPVMPGVLMVEALAQACGILVHHSYTQVAEEKSKLFLLTGIDKTRFKRVVEPGDQLMLNVELVSDRHQLLKCKGTATVDGQIACFTELSCVWRAHNENQEG